MGHFLDSHTSDFWCPVFLEKDIITPHEIDDRSRGNFSLMELKMENKQNADKEFLNSCKGLIYLAEQLLKSCKRKKQKVHSHTRYIVSFFFRRSFQMLKSFILLIEENRVVDGAVLLRSLCDMCINLEYIFFEDKTKEINALTFRLNGETVR